MNSEVMDINQEEGLENLSRTELSRRFLKVSRELEQSKNEHYFLSKEYEAALASIGDTDQSLTFQIIKAGKNKKLKAVLRDCVSAAQDIIDPDENLDLEATRKYFLVSLSKILSCGFVLKDLNDSGIQINQQAIALAEYIDSLEVRLVRIGKEIENLTELKSQIKSILDKNQKRKTIIRFTGSGARPNEESENRDVVFSVRDFLEKANHDLIVFSESALDFLLRLKQKLKTPHSRLGATERSVVGEFQNDKSALAAISEIILKLLKAQKTDKFRSIRNSSRSNILKWSSDGLES